MNRPTAPTQSSRPTQSGGQSQTAGLTPTEEAQFAQSAMALLQQGAQQLVPKIRHRLDEARLHALRAQKTPTQFFWQRSFAPAFGGQTGSQLGGDAKHGPIFNMLMWLAASAAVIFGLMAITDWQQESRLQDLAVLDAAILTDDVPPNAYADSGFLAFLKAHRDLSHELSPDSLEPAAANAASPS